MSYPVMLALKGKKCLIAGAGRVAERKAAALLEAGAKVHVVSPRSVAYFRGNRRIKFIKRKFRERDLDDKFLVIAATGDDRANSRICGMASDRNMLANNAGSRNNANFMNMAWTRRRGLVIAVSSQGRSVRAAVRMRNMLVKRGG